MDAQSIPTPTADSPRRRAQHGINLYYARQLLPSPLTSSSSYDYWWPYPPAGATTTASSTPTTFLDPSTNTLLASPTDTTPTLVFSFESNSAISSSSDSLDVTSLSPPIASSSSASESIISISALPPSNTTIPVSSHTKLSMVPPSNLVYVVPICGAVGLLVGGITAWCVYGCLTRNGHGRRRGRKSYGTLEVGPEYTPPSPRLGEKEDYEEEQGEWVGDEKHAEECATDDTIHGDNASDDDDDERGGANETAGFLHPGSAQTRPRPAHYTVRTKTDASASTVSTAARTKSSRSSRAPSPSPSGRTSLFFDRPDSTDAVPWESLRHKSIKRGILERLRDDGQQQDSLARRPWHSRHDSDLLVADADAEVSLARTASSVTSAALSRALSTITASTGHGFRIMPESPGETPRGERGADVFRWPSMQEDKYTRVPVRVARSRSRSPEKASRAASPEKYERGRSPDKLARAASPPVHRGGGGRGRTADRASVPSTCTSPDFRNVLPQSPPRISSPVLDSVLCFTPIPEAEADATPQMASFASFGAPAAEGVGNGRGERVFGGAEKRGRQ